MKKSDLEVGKRLLFVTSSKKSEVVIARISRDYLFTECGKRVAIDSGMATYMKKQCGRCWTSIEELDNARLNHDWQIFKSQIGGHSYEPPKDLTIESLNQARKLIFGVKNV